MKKMMQILIITLLIFIGINGVKAEDGESIGTYEGTCKVASSSDNPFDCLYNCSIFKDEAYLKFDYHIFLDNGNLEQEIVGNSIKTIEGENSFFGFNGSTQNSLSSAVMLEKLNNTLKVSVEKQPLPSQFKSKGKLVCKNISTKTDLYIDSKYFSALNYITKYNTYTNKITISIDNLDENDGDDKVEIDTSCGLLGGKSSEVVSFLRKIFGYIKVIIPLLIILLSIVDLLNNVFTGKDDDMKKSISKFIKRMIIAIVFILVPTLISIIINISGVTSQYSQVSDGLKAVFCVLK